VLLAAYIRLLAARARVADLAILTPLAGREHPQIAPLIGDFINLVPLRIAAVPGLSPAALIDQVKQQVRSAARHQALQLDELVDELGLPLDPDRNPLTGFSLNFMPHSGRMPAPPPPGVIDKGYKLKYDVLFLVRDYEDATTVEIQFRAGVLGTTDAGLWFDEFCTATEGLRHD
jgi:non-ribosomal peptide synthetase component F